MNVDVAVIPAAGAGTRMRPATRTVPKPLIPVLEKPTIQYVVEEAVHAGASEVVFVLSDTRIITHFTEGPSIPGLEHVRFRHVVQESPLGLGDAVLCAREVVGDRPFSCLLSDRFTVPGTQLLASMAASFDGSMVLALERVHPSTVDRYGIVSVTDRSDGGWDVHAAVEKPRPGTAPSDLALVGRYVFTPDIFEALSVAKPGAGGEIQLTDAINALCKVSPARGVLATEELLDTGLPHGLAEATVAVALTRPDLAEDFRAFLIRQLGK